MLQKQTTKAKKVLTLEKIRPTYQYEIPDRSIFSTVSDLQTNTRFARHTALCYIPPTSIWEPIQEIRQVMDKGFTRWPPHINLLFPFIPEGCFDAAATLLKKELANFEPFECTFHDINCFRKGSSVLWLDQDEHAVKQVVELQKRVAALFPYCDEKKNEKGEFIPHLTIGYTSQNIVDKTMSELKQQWKSVTVPVGEICMIFRPDVDTSFTTIHKIPLGKE
ncbi:hypothetical protein FDP41_008342 [Naegleria fowleri]|uniref:2'-5' RNA ligase family protein n=1 Tax=Naegleria fowleri TaxID=5763 RepID=A0A6A5BGK2_NAEFO|nr:uncharacterized protein FDP41_008342 [Naegleria fowleri]KAF0973135.1 hypothetical protein FDP41_008342 [Naegleria fowleri]CAG4716053.1 unnamed protein product [Naegleria fowleri]